MPKATKENTNPPASIPQAATAPLDGEKNQVFRQEVAAFVPGSVKFGSAPAALVRLKENLYNVIAARRHVDAARSTLEQLKAERVTGTEISGAESILGADLPYFERLICEAESVFNTLAGVTE